MIQTDNRGLLAVEKNKVRKREFLKIGNLEVKIIFIPFKKITHMFLFLSFRCWFRLITTATSPGGLVTRACVLGSMKQRG